MTNSRYFNPFTDFGFKKLFGEESNKDLLIDFLNSILPNNHKIKDLSFKNNEKLGRTETDKKAVFDIFCKSENEEEFIVEMQKGKQVYFKDRTVFYSTFPIQEQAQKGEWDYKLNSVYCISLLDFNFNKNQTEEESKEVIHTVKLKNQKNQVFYDKLTYVYFELPNFKKLENELKTNIDKWLYLLKNLDNLDDVPRLFQGTHFEKVFVTGELSKMNKSDRFEYENSLKIFRDYKSTLDTAKLEGKIEGLIEGEQIGLEKGIKEGKKEGERNKSIEIAKNLKNLGISIESISEATGLTIEEIEKL